MRSSRRADKRLTLSASALADGSVELPRVCTRHGRAADPIDLSIPSRGQSSTSLYAASAGPASLATRISEQIASRHLTSVQGWPFCPRCSRRQRANTWACRICAIGGPLLVVATVIVGFIIGPGDNPVGAAVGSAGVLIFLATSIPLHHSWPHRVAKAMTSEDGTTVVINRPSAAFAQAVDHHRLS